MKLLCPICRKPVDSEADANFPFCSERCRTADLGNWAAERYKISSPAMDESEIEENPAGENGNKRPRNSPDGDSEPND